MPIFAFANAGLPPLSGFIGKLAILEGAIGTAGVRWMWGAMLAGGLLATVALARAGSRLFWKVGPPSPTSPRLAPLEAAAIAFLGASAVALAVLAAPAQRFAAAAAAQLAAPDEYVRSVLGAPPVPGPGRHATLAGEDR